MFTFFCFLFFFKQASYKNNLQIIFSFVKKPRSSHNNEMMCNLRQCYIVAIGESTVILSRTLQCTVHNVHAHLRPWSNKALQSILPDCPYTQNRNKSRGSVSSTLLLHVLLYYSVQYGKSCSGHPYNCVYITLCMPQSSWVIDTCTNKTVPSPQKFFVVCPYLPA